MNTGNGKKQRIELPWLESKAMAIGLTGNSSDKDPTFEPKLNEKKHNLKRGPSGVEVDGGGGALAVVAGGERDALSDLSLQRERVKISQEKPGI